MGKSIDGEGEVGLGKRLSNALPCHNEIYSGTITSLNSLGPELVRLSEMIHLEVAVVRFNTYQ